MNSLNYIIKIISLTEIHSNITYEIISDNHILVDKEHYQYFLNHKHTEFIEENSIHQLHSRCSKTKSWGLDRINQKNLPFDTNYNFNSTDSELIDIYVIDTGVDINHEEFSHKKPIILESFGSEDQICNGHGTHVAGIIGGKNIGLSTNSNIFSIKISHNCKGSAWCSDMIKAIKLSTKKMIESGRKSVINLSYSVCYLAVEELNNFMNNGGIVSLSAGNDNNDISENYNYKNFDVLKGFIVGATNKNDELASYSNYGDNVYIYSPGSSIISADYSDDDSCIYLSGTSMAAPLVTAAIAIYWNKYFESDNKDIISKMILESSKNIIKTDKNIHNNLLFLPYIDKNLIDYVIKIIFLIIFLIFICIILYIFYKKKNNISPKKINNIKNNERIGEKSITEENKQIEIIIKKDLEDENDEKEGGDVEESI